MYNDLSTNLLYSSHSHPGKFDSNTGWPAYPSGFDTSLRSTNSTDGDRPNYEFYNNEFSGRIPATFNIFVPNNTDAVINYNNISVQRTLPPIQLEEVIIKVKRK